MAIQSAILASELNQLDEASIDEVARQYFALSDFEGFIHHPDNIPLKIRVPSSAELTRARLGLANFEHCTGIGLSFDSEKYYSPGQFLEIHIKLNRKEQTFVSRVVMVRSHDAHYTIGIWFDQKQEAARIRNVEQACHLENYLREKRYTDGPFVSNEIVAKQWLSSFTNVFPAI